MARNAAPTTPVTFGDEGGRKLLGDDGDDFLRVRGVADPLIGNDGNNFLVGGERPPDGAQVILGGYDDFDTCDRGLADDDSADPTFETSIDI